VLLNGCHNNTTARLAKLQLTQRNCCQVHKKCQVMLKESCLNAIQRHTGVNDSRYTHGGVVHTARFTQSTSNRLDDQQPCLSPQPDWAGLAHTSLSHIATQQLNVMHHHHPTPANNTDNQDQVLLTTCGTKLCVIDQEIDVYSAQKAGAELVSLPHQPSDSLLMAALAPSKASA
jgi:hypothetical protein